MTRVALPTGRWFLGLAALAAWGVLYRCGRAYGTTRAERRASLPGDDLVDRAQVTVTHATSIPAPAEQVWPWLVQVGWHRAGWYTPRWVDVLFFPDNWPSAKEILPQHQALDVGDTVPDGPPRAECYFVVRELVPARCLVLDSTTHLPLRWRERGRAHLHWTWSFTLTPLPDRTGTRLVVRWRARVRPWWLTVVAHLFVVPADFVMSRGLLRGVRSRVVGRVERPESHQAGR